MTLTYRLQMGLNPYCSGRWSRTGDFANSDVVRAVLILIVVEDGLVQSLLERFSLMVQSLNTYCSGRWSRT